MKQAVREQKHYALVCVDCTDKTGCNVSPDATEEEVNAQIEDILKHTYVHRDIGELLNDTLSPLVKREDEGKHPSLPTITAQVLCDCWILLDFTGFC
jgi:hypothetical protein